MNSTHLLRPHHGSHKTLWFGLVGTIVVIVGSILLAYAQTQKKEAEKMNPTKPVPSNVELQRQLTKDQYHVTRECGTETPFQNAYWDNHRAGIYVDIVTGEPLFSSLDKFDSGTGLPAFSKPISKDLLVENLDTSHDMQRTEVRAKRSNAHLGYLFPDPKSPTGQNYSVYSAAFHFIPTERMKGEGYEAFLSLLDKKPATP